jgi:hypothetical protein
MSKILYVVRHRKAEDQHPEAALTAEKSGLRSSQARWHMPA